MIPSKRYKHWNFLDNAIKECMSKRFHRNENHPIGKVRLEIEKFFKKYGFLAFHDLNPCVSIEDNFDNLLISWDHISRDDAYLVDIDKDTILRTHTTAHQVPLLKDGKKSFMVSGDVYRREDIDAYHYSCFYQCDVASVQDKPLEEIKSDLQLKIEDLIFTLLGDVEILWVETYYKFSEPSWEVYVKHKNEFIEILGCGIIHEEILKNCGMENENGWAFGIGLDRVAMIMFDIPDIRLMWEKDDKNKETN